MEENNINIVEIRLDKAKEALSTAELNFQNDFLTAANNRLYYAVFYAASALLYKNNHVAKSHNGVKTLLHQHFFKTQILPYRFAEMYNQLFDLRHESDYDDIFFVEKEEIEPYLEEVKAFIETIEALI
jgi:uncharacterized protein